MKPSAEELEYLVRRYWLHYFPELTGKRWTSNQVKSDKEIIAILPYLERKLLRDHLLMFNKMTVESHFGNRGFLYFEWRLEVSGYGAQVIEPLCAMDLMLALGEVLPLAEKDSSLSAYRRFQILCRPSYHIIARVMNYISKTELPELLTHEHEFIRGAATRRLTDSSDEGSYIYRYRVDSLGTGSFGGLMLPL